MIADKLIEKADESRMDTESQGGLMSRLDKESRLKRPEDFSDQPFELGQAEETFTHSPHQDKNNIRLRPHGNWSHPGVSGKTYEGEAYLNEAEYEAQTDIVGHRPKKSLPSDERIYEEVCEELMKNTQVDASNIGVKIEGGIVFLSGKVADQKMKKMVEMIVEDLPGVHDVINELSIVRGNKMETGPDAATKKDLGLS